MGGQNDLFDPEVGSRILYDSPEMFQGHQVLASSWGPTEACRDYSYLDWPQKEELMLEVRYIELAKMKPWKENPRLNDRAVDAVAYSIQQFGFNVPILCDQEFTIVAGHVRWKAAQKLGMGSVPVVELQLSDAQRRAFSIADNKTAQIAEWDYPALADILRELESEEIDLLSLGFSDGELQALLEPENDFDFSEFEDDVLSTPDLSHVSLAVKVPIDLKGAMKRAIERYAAEKGIAEEDLAVLAGKVFAALLEVAPCRSR